VCLVSGAHCSPCFCVEQGDSHSSLQHGLQPLPTGLPDMLAGVGELWVVENIIYMNWNINNNLFYYGCLFEVLHLPVRGNLLNQTLAVVTTRNLPFGSNVKWLMKNRIKKGKQHFCKTKCKNVAHYNIITR
jgi:hypothetical protein